MPQYEAALLMMGCDIKETAGEERETYQTKRLKESFDIITHGLTIISARLLGCRACFYDVGSFVLSAVICKNHVYRFSYCGIYWLF